jgi:hypothetical protein
MGKDYFLRNQANGAIVTGRIQGSRVSHLVTLARLKVQPGAPSRGKKATDRPTLYNFYKTVARRLLKKIVTAAFLVYFSLRNFLEIEMTRWEVS